ncbi:MAG: sulfatase [Halobaculum sp.]
MKTLLVTVDSLRPDHLGQYGYERETFQALDPLLVEGDRYTAAYANGTHSAESIPSFLRSRYQPSLDSEEPSLASVLSRHGVRTGAIHSNTVYDELVGESTADFDSYQFLVETDEVAEEPSLTKRLFRGAMDTVRPVVERLGIRNTAEHVQEFLFPSELIHTLGEYTKASAVTDTAIRWIRETDGEFFLWVHYMDPHRPYGVSDEAYAYGELPSHSESSQLMSKAGVSPDTVTDDERRRMRDWYDSDVRYTSHHVGRLLEFVRAEVPETGVVFTADHGDEFGEHGAYFHRNRPYDELIHVPLVVDGPDTDGRVCNEQRQLVDLAPTVCQWHGLPVPESFEGEPLRSGTDRRVFATGSHLDDTAILAGRWDGWKFIQAPDPELYDLTADPGETENVFGRNEDVARRYDRTVTRQLEHRDASVGAEDADERTRERLAELGYLDDSIE